MTSVFDEGGVARSNEGFISYWQSVIKGRSHLTEEDFEHITKCESCKEKLFASLQSGDLKVSAELMSKIKDDAMRQQIVRIICLRAVGSSILN